jgi:hypothetical protein
MLRQNDYPSHDDMLVIDWHHAGALENPAGNTRAAYYGASAAPDVYFDGYDNVLGAGDSTVAYGQYRTRVNNHIAAQARMLINDARFNLDVNTMTATVEFEAEVPPGETIANPEEVTMRCAAYEDDIFLCCEPQTGNNVWHHIGQALGTGTTLTISQGGETQQYVGTFPIDADWDLDQIHVVAIVQRDSNKRILQAGEACRMYSVSVENIDPTVTSSSGPVDFDAEVTYTGCVDDDVVVTLDKSGLPGDWDAEIVVGVNTFPITTTFSGMTSGQVQPYAIRVIPGATAALGTVSVETAPATNPAFFVTDTYSVFANTEAILYVNDDTGGSSQAAIEDAIANAGHFFYTQDVDTQGNPTEAFMAGFDAILWNTGQLQAQTISPAMQTALISYLDGGGKFFLSSHGILNQHGTGPTFIRDYLRVLSFQQDWQALSCTGVAGDPIGDGLSFALSGPFPDFADLVVPNTGGVVWLVGQFGDVAVRYETEDFQTVFMTPAIELVPDGDQDVVIDRVLNWFFPPVTGVEPSTGAEPIRLALRQNAPNPFTGETSVRFAVPASGPVNLDVFDVGGRRVARLVNGPLRAGNHTVSWDGRDATGARVASGIYLYRLTAGGESLSREMMLMK